MAVRAGRFAAQMHATRATPPILAALALLLATPVPRQRAPEPEPAPTRMAVTIAAGPQLAGDIIVPGKFRDADAWPHGMVIRPPETHDRIAVAGPLPDVLAALLAPLLPPALLL